MDFKSYRQTTQDNLPPALEAGTILKSILSIQENNFQLGGMETKGMHVTAIDASGKQVTYRTSSKVIMSQLEEFFKNHPKESLDNVKVTAPRGKKYLTLEEA